jgi:hypothetical protein
MFQYQYYISNFTNQTKRAARQLELDRVLQSHMKNPNIDAIHLLLESKDSHMDEVLAPLAYSYISSSYATQISDKKVFISVIGSMLTFKTALEYAHYHLQGILACHNYN